MTPSGEELIDAVTRLSAILDGFPVEIKEALRGPRRIPRWGRWVIFALAVSLAGNVASVAAVGAIASRGQTGNRQMLDQANTVLAAARQQQAANTADEKAARALDQVCFRNEFAVYFAGAKPDPRCGP